MSGRSTVTRKGQITIPIEIRRRLGIQVGDQVEFIESGATLQLARIDPANGMTLVAAIDELAPDSPIRAAAGSLSRYAKRDLTVEERQEAEERAIELGWTERERRFLQQRSRDRG